MQQLISSVLHLDQSLATWTQSWGPWVYLFLFAIVFAETGFVVTPFLPGDSLLFAAGSLCSIENSTLNLFWLNVSLIVAAVLGDALNYRVGFWVGPKVFSTDSKWLKKEHLEKTKEFYEKYGSKAVVMGRFLPIFRTFVPFVAGIGQMEYRKFSFYNVVGGVLWVTTFTLGGAYFGNLEIVKRNFHLVILAILVISALPAFITWCRTRTACAKG